MVIPCRKCLVVYSSGIDAPENNRRSPRMLFVCALFMLVGAAMWRMNYSLVAYNPGNGYHYFPTASELLISIGFVAFEVTAYILIIRLLPVLPAQTESNIQLKRLRLNHEPTHYY